MAWKLPTFEKTEFKKKKNKYCLIIPVINEGEKFKKQIKNLKRYSQVIDIIIADGGSIDGSTQKTFLRQQGVRALLVKTSSGKLGAQYRMAFAYAVKEGYQGVVTMDGNNKDGPTAIHRFIKELDNGYDYIQGSRFLKGGKAINTPLGRYLGIRFILSPTLSFGARRWYTDTSNGFRAYSIKLLTHAKMNLFRKIFVSYEILFYITVRSSRIGLKIKEIPVVRKYPETGKIPTKITTPKAKLLIILNAIRASLGYFNP